MTIRSLMRLLLIAVSLSFCFHSVATGQLTEQLRSMAQRRKADDMLKRARQAIDDGNLALAEWYIDRVDRMEVKYDSMFGRIAETPEKLRAEIAQRKTSQRLTDVLKDEAYATHAAQTIPDKSGLPGGQFVPTTQPPKNLAAPPKDANPPPNRQESIPDPVPPPRAEPVVESPKARARRMLARAWAALGEGNVSAAAGWYQNAVACEAEFAEGEFSPADLAGEFRSRGVDVAALLAKAGTQPVEAPKSRKPAMNEVVQKPASRRDPAGQLTEQLRSMAQRRKADDMLKMARQAIDDGNLALAEWYADRVDCMEVKYDSMFGQLAETPDKLRAEIAQRKISQRLTDVPLSKAAAQLGETPKSGEPAGNEVVQKPAPLRDPAALAVMPASREEPVNESDPNSDPALLEAASISSSRLLQRGAKILTASALTPTEPNWKQQRENAVALLAQAQAALHRDDLAVATQLVKQANDLTVPDAAYESGDLRPWMLQMEIDKRQKRIATAHPGASSGDSSSAARAFSPPPMPVQHALPQVELAGSPEAPPTGVATAEYPQAIPNTFAQRSVGRPAAAGLVYDPLHDETRNIMASGQQALPMPDQSATIPAPPNVATPFPIQGITRVPTDGTAMLSSPSGLPAPTGPQAGMTLPPVHLDSMSESLPGIELRPEAMEPTLAQPTPAAPYGNTAEGPPSQRDRTSPHDSLSDSNPEGPRANAPSASEPRVKDSLGYPLFRDGQEALGNQDFGRAAELFHEAWQYESELDPETRQALQDNLQIVRSRHARAAATREVDPVELSPTPDEQRVAEQFINDLSRQQATARALRKSDPTKAWDELKKMRQLLENAALDDNTRQTLLLRVDKQIEELDQYVQANRSRIENDTRNQRILEEIDRRRATKARNQEQLAELVDQFNELMDQQRFPEASIVAKKARELDPLNPVVETMMYKTNIVRQLRSKLLRDEAFSRNAVATYSSIDEAATPMEDDSQVEFPRYWEDLTKRRKRYSGNQERRYTEVELEIRRSLQTKVDVKFENMPLGEVVDKLAKLGGVNAYLDPEGLASEGVASDTTVNISLRKPVSLKSALNLILQPLHLSYVIQDEVLRITSEQVRQGDVHTQVYPVADLVIPVPNFFPNNNVGLPGAIREAYNVIGRSQTLGGFSTGGLMQAPLTISQDETQPGAGGNASVLAQMAAGGLLPQSARGAGSNGLLPGAPGGASQADFDILIDLIQTTVEPDSWEELGGQGAIDGFQGNLSLVVSQTQDVHEQIADLLAQLRRLQDLQVTIEVRFISLNDDFFERIGVDFDFDIENNSGLNASDVNIAAYDGPNITIGLDPNGMPTADLDIPFTQDSFAATIPTFGGFDPNSAATIGFAILSDIEAFFLIQAAQGDSRTNVLQAPKVTLFNGQAASVQDQSQVPFVTSVIPVVGDFAVAQQPVITVLSEGTSLNVRAVVSQDRRFIRLDLVPFFSEIGDVDTFTFEGRLDSDSGTVAVDPTDDTSSVVNNALNNTVGTTVQLPTLAFTTVNTTVSVPDGGTILLGGIKRLREGRNEQGVPMLSKLPYINRLFTNVGIGRETQSLMMMVTPRIIIQEEEERKLLEGN